LYNAFSLLLAGAFSSTIILPIAAPQLAGTPAGWLFTGVATLIIWGLLVLLLHFKLKHEGES